jgi:hypothetical protein
MFVDLDHLPWSMPSHGIEHKSINRKKLRWYLLVHAPICLLIGYELGDMSNIQHYITIPFGQ